MAIKERLLFCNKIKNEVSVMKAGLYKVETIDKRTVLLTPNDEQNDQCTFPISEFTFDISEGDVVEIWREGTKWKTKYREEETKSTTSHLKDFKNRILDQE